MAKNGKMIILRGNSDPKGEQEYTDEFGKPASWPIGALHKQAAEDYARKRDYEPVTLPLEGQQSGYKGKQVQEFLKQFAGITWVRNHMKSTWASCPIQTFMHSTAFAAAPTMYIGS